MLPVELETTSGPTGAPTDRTMKQRSNSTNKYESENFDQEKLRSNAQVIFFNIFILIWYFI